MRIKWFNTSVQIFLSCIGLPVVAVQIYLLAVALTSLIFVGGEPKGDQSILLISNGVHVDLCLPADAIGRSFTRSLAGKEMPQRILADASWLAFGWGDKGFYLNTPTWADLNVSTAVHAALMPGPAAMHLSCYALKPQGKKVAEIAVSPQQMQLITNYIQDTFGTETKQIAHPGYAGVPNAFYEATGSYSALHTCNCWTNTALKNADIKTPLWAPLEWSLRCHFK